MSGVSAGRDWFFLGCIVMSCFVMLCFALWYYPLWYYPLGVLCSIRLSVGRVDQLTD